MNLIIDIGNTRTKVAVFNNGSQVDTIDVNDLSTTTIQKIKATYPQIKKGIVSSVKKNSSELVNRLSKEFEFVINLDHTLKLPIENLYQTPETLGKDRIAAAVGANKVFPNQNLLVIDAGTAITYDFINDQNQYLGGFITPGLKMRFEALNHFTDKLPLLEPEFPQNYSGLNTEQSIRGGIQYGLEGEIRRFIDHFSTAKKNISIILTGGDTKYFEKLLKNYKFVALEIINTGLNTILESNYIR